MADHWNTIITATLSIIGTLGGLWLGSYIQRQRDVEQQKYTDRTRFHDVRLDAYHKYAAATTGIIGGATVWANDHVPVSIATFLSTHDLLTPYNTSLSLARLVASPDVAQKVGAANDCCIEVLEMTVHADMAAARQRLIIASAAFETAARNELGIE
jgi:hypothetical protein